MRRRGKRRRKPRGRSGRPATSLECQAREISILVPQVSLPSHHLELTIRGEHGELSLRQMEMVLA